MSSSNNKRTWYIAGIGALGSVLATCFHRGGHSPTLIMKKAQLKNYKTSGLTLVQDEETYTCYPTAVDIIEPNAPIDYLICCVKAYDVCNLLSQLKNNLHPASVVILIHNGLGVMEEIKKQLPSLRIISGITTIGAYVESPFKVHAFLNGKFHLGNMLGEFAPNEINTISTVFHAAKLPLQWENDMPPMLWEKFALNCSINILTAIFECKNGDLLACNTLLEDLTAEIAQVISAYGINMSGKSLYTKVMGLLDRVGNNYSSTYKDVQHKRSTEIPFLNGHLVKLAQQKKLAVPVNIALLTQFYSKILYLSE